MSELPEREATLLAIIRHFIENADAATLKDVRAHVGLLTPYKDINEKLENYIEWEFKKRRKGR